MDYEIEYFEKSRKIFLTIKNDKISITFTDSEIFELINKLAKEDVLKELFTDIARKLNTCPFPLVCNAFPCDKMECNADSCDNGYVYKFS